jgi:hypothetical protein
MDFAFFLKFKTAISFVTFGFSVPQSFGPYLLLNGHPMIYTNIVKFQSFTTSLVASQSGMGATHFMYHVHICMYRSKLNTQF